jgi:hypothetical protein
LETRRQLVRRLGLAALAGLLSWPAMRRASADRPPQGPPAPDLELVDGWVLRADDRTAPVPNRNR